MTGAVHHKVNLEKAYRNAAATREECEEELENAQSMGNKKRIAECKRWLAEAKHYEQEAREKLQAQQRTAPQ